MGVVKYIVRRVNYASYGDGRGYSIIGPAIAEMM